VKRVYLGLVASCLLACSADRDSGGLDSDDASIGGSTAGQTGGITGAVSGGATGTASTGGSTGASSGGPAEVGCKKMDILFVIDNSGSMAEEQANLSTNFPKFIDVLNTAREGLLDYRVGVTTTAFPLEILGIPLGDGEQGTLLKTRDMTRPWLERSDANLSTTFTTLAQVGIGGSGQEQPLKAALSALTDRVADGANAGFIRDDALLAIVVLTDEDDQSADDQGGGGLPFPIPGTGAPVAKFIEGFDMVKKDRTRWATAVIAGATAPECESVFGSAAYAARLEEFVTATGKNAVFSSICSGDLSGSLNDALQTFTAACEDFTPL
jgi:hypothetical protein